MLPSWSPGPSDISISPHTQGSPKGLRSFVAVRIYRAQFALHMNNIFSVLALCGNVSVCRRLEAAVGGRLFMF